MLLVLVRHGESEANSKRIIQGQRDYPLTDNGKHQAQLLAKRLATWPQFNALYTSPLTRARQTAEVIEAEVGIHATVIDEAKEIGLGNIEGHTLEEIQLLYPDVFNQILENGIQRSNLPGRESQQAFRKRVKGMFDKLCQRHQGERVLLVTHSGVIRNFIGYIFGLDSAAPLLCHNTSLHIVEVTEEKSLIHTINDYCHLERDGVHKEY